MERDFHHWDSFRSLPCNDFDKDSICSCTDSCLNDDETDLIAFEDPEKLLLDSNCEKAMVNIVVLWLRQLAMLMKRNRRKK